MFLSTSDKVQNQKLKVQELAIRFADTHLYSTSGSDTYIQIGDAVSAIVSVLNCDNSASAIVMAQASALSIVDSSALTAGGDLKAIKVAGLQMAANDIFVVKYIA